MHFMKTGGYKKLCPILAVSFVGALASQVSPAQSASELPPNWKSGGDSREGYYHEENNKRIKKRRRKQEDVRDQSSKDPNAPEAQFEPAPSRSKRSTFAVYASSPEIARVDYRFSVSPHFAFAVGLGVPVPIDVEVSMPSDVIKADQSKSIAVAYPAFDINLKVAWGPHAHAGMIWHPLGGVWYASLAGGVRSLKVSGSTSAPLRICSVAEAAKEPPCGNDNAAIQTRNVIALETDIKMQSTYGRVATGWIYNLGPAWALTAEVGAFVPFSTKEDSSVKASIVAPDGTPEDLSGALGDLRSKSEKDLDQKAREELGRFSKAPLPVLALGIGFRF
jgi:hypothetical protein